MRKDAPPARSVTANVLRLYMTGTISMPARPTNSTAARLVDAANAGGPVCTVIAHVVDELRR